MKKLLLISLSLCFTLSLLAQQKLYKKVDVNGAVQAVEMPKVIAKDYSQLNQQRNANTDTLLIMTFDNDTAIPDQNNGGDWLNFSYDQLIPANYTRTDWFIVDSVFVQDLANGDTVDVTRMALSASWMQGLAIGNRNALVTPAITITGQFPTLSFSTMPAQGPQWMDGYTIKVDDIGDPQNPNSDTLVQNKQYGGTGDGPLWSQSYNWNTIPGDTLHTAYNYTDSLATFTDSGNATVALENWIFSLDAYAGQTIYITFYHDSDDDNALLLDDILITQLSPVGLESKNEEYARLYPNPAQGFVNFEFMMKNSQNAQIEIIDTKGVMVKNLEVKHDGYGMQKTRIETQDLEKGIYFIKLFNGEKTITEKLYIE